MYCFFRSESHDVKSVFLCYSALSLDDEIRVIGQLINGFIRSISFGRDFEQQLSFYVEARMTFSNIDAVVVNLVQVCDVLIVVVFLIRAGFVFVRSESRAWSYIVLLTT